MKQAQTIDDWISQIDQTTKDFQSSFGSLSSDQLNWKPNPDTWSIAQNIDHLITVNESYYPMLAAVRAGTYQPPFHARIGFLVSFLGKTVLRAVKPDRAAGMKTFPIWEPSDSQFTGDILDRFAAHQAELKKEIAAAASLLEKGIIIASPANRNIVYKLEMAFEIIVTHERRHLVQARELLSLVNQVQ